MRRILTIISIWIGVSMVVIPNALSQGISDYLIVTNIGAFGASKNPTAGQGSGILAGADHFYQDHKDMTYRISYFDLATRSGAKVQVTQHAGSDSDRWLLHETDRDFRNYYGLPSESYVMRVINDNTVMAFGAGGWDYRWLSDDKVINIKYTDLQMTKPEPLEIVNAYLAKHPSTLPSMTSTELRTDENKTKWIKDEMERRLWLCEKWLQQLDEGKIEQYKVLSAIVDNHLNVFLDYREKYYGISAAEDKQTLSGYLLAKNEKEIRKKLTEYKQWWAENKTKPINLP